MAKVLRCACLIAAASLSAFLSGCATPIAVTQLRGAPPAVPPRVELEAVPFFPQERYQCGPAALATVLVHQGVAVSPQQLQPEVYLPEQQGSLQVEMVAAARRRGRLVYPLESPHLSNLISEVAAGHPVLVMQNLGLNWLPQWHYAVVVGYDLDKEQLVLRSATVKRWQSTFKLFERTWARAGHWGLVIVAPEQIPSTATALGFLRAAYDLEAVGDSDSAARAYQSAYLRWPREYAVAFAMGNLLYAQGKFAEAEAVLRSALGDHPKQPGLWNNLAYALAARGCMTESLESVRCARQLVPHDANIADSERELETRSGNITSRAQGCQRIDCPIM